MTVTAEAVRWVTEEWLVSLASTLESLTGEPLKTASVEVTPAADVPQPALTLGQPFWWAQEFSVAPGPSVSIGASKQVWLELGRVVLQAAGIPEGSEEDAQAAWLEILSQSLSLLAHRLASRLGTEVTCASVHTATAAEACEYLASIDARVGGRALILFFGISGRLASLVGQQWEEAPPVHESPDRLPASASETKSHIISRLQCLFDTEVAVRVVVGRVQLPLEEILQLTSGSLIELNRSVSEPAELFINDRFIGYGEAVLVNGNYGIRVRSVTPNLPLAS